MSDGKADTVTIKRGQLYDSGDGLWISVTRVSRTSEWADIEVWPKMGLESWRKRQRLIDGSFPYARTPTLVDSGEVISRG